MKRRTKLLKQLICIFKGHIGLKRDTSFTHTYVQDGKEFVYNGRLYKCKRCGALRIFYGVTLWELKDLIEVTLKDLPPIDFDVIFAADTYEFTRFYAKEKN